MAAFRALVARTRCSNVFGVQKGTAGGSSVPLSALSKAMAAFARRFGPRRAPGSEAAKAQSEGHRSLDPEPCRAVQWRCAPLPSFG